MNEWCGSGEQKGDTEVCDRVIGRGLVKRGECGIVDKSGIQMVAGRHSTPQHEYGQHRVWQ